MSSNGSYSAPDAIATAIESINTLSIWLKEAGLDESAIAHFKYNALAKQFPDLADIIEDAKKLISTKAPIPEVGLTVSEIASRLSEELERKIKPVQVNQALVELGFQVRPDNGKRIWQLTEEGKEYGFSRLATSKTNDWSGAQVTWGKAVIPILIDYFEKADSLDLELSETTEDIPTPEPEEKAWTLVERIKAIKKKITASQRLHIEMEAAQAYKERHGKPPAKEQANGKFDDVYPAADLDLVDEAIDQVLKRYAKS